MMNCSIFVFPQEKEEQRVALTPLAVPLLTRWGATVTVLDGSFSSIGYDETSYQQEGAKITKDKDKALAAADIVLTLHPPSAASLGKMKKNAILIGLLDDAQDKSFLEHLKKHSLKAFSLERLPRITRAQGMDVLSSQSNLAGYRAVLEAGIHYPRLFPMMMTAAGSIKAARLFVIGAGVAGLQALATARRLGAITSAYDVREAALEQVQSVGASFIKVDDDDAKSSEDKTGYARDVSASYKKKQAQLLESHIQKQDIIITTALIPNKPAPILIDKKMVESMRHGSVIVDLAAQNGGNCALTQKNDIITHKGVTIIGFTDLPARMNFDASFLYGRNITQFVTSLFKPTEQGIVFDASDEIIKATLLTET